MFTAGDHCDRETIIVVEEATSGPFRATAPFLSKGRVPLFAILARAPSARASLALRVDALFVTCGHARRPSRR
ncbi:hypothetical protein EAS62_20310 [Bradyrhizobium zhanjiangense]|uniref:Uncharacterized protein n=1 Tax=Bradyrhizobium zhanjiangense TaxID=1325107 RepID=A0ABY0DIC3_9BRAD|nr:hypothetical protein EAS62_20310 [Bradyrhizobium zhanjiangense]